MYIEAKANPRRFSYDKWKDHAKQCKYLTDNGNKKAQYLMGKLSQLAVNKNKNSLKMKSLAMVWFYISYQNGYQEAKQEFYNLLKSSRKEDIARAYIGISNTYKQDPKIFNLKSPDYKSSWEMEKLAAKHGNIMGYIALSTGYGRGYHYSYKNIPKHFPESYKWSFLAKNNYGTYHDGNGTDIENNQKIAQKVMDKLRSFMTEKQINETKISLRKWLKENPEFVPDMNEALRKVDDIK